MDLSRILNQADSEDSSNSRVPRPSSPSPPPQLDSVPELAAWQLEDADENLPNVSFIVAMEAEGEARGKVCYLSPTALDLMGWDSEEVLGTPASLYCHPDDVPNLYRAYQEMISEDKAACLMYHRIPYKDKSKGHLLCSVTISRAGRHLIGACSPATSALKAMHSASTAQEVIVITPSAARLTFKRWNIPAEPSSRETTPPTQIGMPTPEPTIKTEEDEITLAMNSLTLSPSSKPEVAPRVALILDRFSMNVPVIFATNDDIMPRSLIIGRPFYDFITRTDEKRLRKAIDTVKRWSVNEWGGPSEGGFAFNRFHLYLPGRDCSVRPSPEPPLRKCRSLQSLSPLMDSGKPDSPPTRNRPKPRITSERGINAPTRETMLVDSIFSPQSDGIIVILRPALTTGVTVYP